MTLNHEGKFGVKHLVKILILMIFSFPSFAIEWRPNQEPFANFYFVNKNGIRVDNFINDPEGILAMQMAVYGDFASRIASLVTGKPFFLSKLVGPIEGNSLYAIRPVRKVSSELQGTCFKLKSKNNFENKVIDMEFSDYDGYFQCMIEFISSVYGMNPNQYKEFSEILSGNKKNFLLKSEFIKISEEYIKESGYDIVGAFSTLVEGKRREPVSFWDDEGKYESPVRYSIIGDSLSFLKDIMRIKAIYANLITGLDIKLATSPNDSNFTLLFVSNINDLKKYRNIIPDMWRGSIDKKIKENDGVEDFSYIFQSRAPNGKLTGVVNIIGIGSIRESVDLYPYKMNKNLYEIFYSKPIFTSWMYIGNSREFSFDFEAYGRFLSQEVERGGLRSANPWLPTDGESLSQMVWFRK